MKKSRFTDEQIAFALKQAETGTRIDEICRKMGISDATFYKWRQKYGGLGPSELRKLKQLEEENSNNSSNANPAGNNNSYLPIDSPAQADLGGFDSGSDGGWDDSSSSGGDDTW